MRERRQTICDGTCKDLQKSKLSSISNLSGRFLRGVESDTNNKPDINNLALSNESNNGIINLTVNQMPRHTHLSKVENNAMYSIADEGNDRHIPRFRSIKPAYEELQKMTDPFKGDITSFSGGKNDLGPGIVNNSIENDKQILNKSGAYTSKSNGDDINILPPFYTVLYIIKFK